ncbi:MAG: hypothetical protein JXA99_14920 [Candidatus Lokiarchaeota archaeon]|nr:hypothetical protein [Candidatus Lokiarchaeota archaeon]
MAEKSGSFKDLLAKWGYKKVADFIALIAGAYGLILLLVDFIMAATSAAGFANAIYGYDVGTVHVVGLGGRMLVDLIVFSCIAFFPLMSKITLAMNNKIKIVPGLEKETAKRNTLYIAWVILLAILFINGLFYSYYIKLYTELLTPWLSSVWYYGIVFILLTLVILQDVIPGMNKEL